MKNVSLARMKDRLHMTAFAGWKGERLTSSVPISCDKIDVLKELGYLHA